MLAIREHFIEQHSHTTQESKFYTEDYMKITIKGGSKLERTLVKSVSNFVRKTYFPRHRSVNINFDLTRKDIDYAYHASCYSWSPRRFHIVVHDIINIKDFIQVLIHEMVHVKQYVLGELNDKPVGDSFKIYWKKEDHTDTPYYKQPWEIEAYQLQKDLYVKFLMF
jgi:hypothetical protein